jgi:type II secretory pathway component PulK
MKSEKKFAFTPVSNSASPLTNQQGVALMMVITSILILTFLWGEFTFESKVSRIRAANILDRTQSRLVAESGLELSLTRLKIYREAYNLLERNANAKQNVSPQLLQQIWAIPFTLPLPLGKNVSAAVKFATEKFQKELLLEGELQVTITNLSSRLNLNMMRLSLLPKPQQQPNPGATGQPNDPNNPPVQPPITQSQQPPQTPQNLDPELSVEMQLARYLQRRMREKNEEDDNFRSKYGSIDPLQLVANIKYYISDPNPRRQNQTQIDMLMDVSEQLFQEKKIAPKYAPIVSYSELSLIPGWDDELIELIRNEFDVFPAVMIDLNKMNNQLLRVLIPTITEDEAKDFFEFRDNPNQPYFFKDLADFKNYFTKQATIMSDSQFDQLFNGYLAHGIQFGSSPTVFKVISEGTVNRTKTTLIATVSLPVQPTSNQAAPGAAPGNQPQPPDTQNPNGQSGQTGQGTQTPQGPQLLEPRIIELEIQ